MASEAVFHFTVKETEDDFEFPVFVNQRTGTSLSCQFKWLYSYSKIKEQHWSSQWFRVVVPENHPANDWCRCPVI